MKRVIVFAFLLYKDIKKDDLISIGNDLTFKMLLSLFPLIIFLLSILGYLELDIGYLTDQLANILPESLLSFIDTFTEEIIMVKNPSILSTALLFAVFSASSGFNTVIKCINKAYGYKDDRHFIIQRLLSVLLVLVFTSTIILSMVMLIFGDHIRALIGHFVEFNGFFNYLFGLVGYIVSLVIILLAVMIINSMAIAKRVSMRSLLPGSILTVTVWIIASKGFNIYINNFSRYSSIYGSVAGIMILMIWLNIICMVLLFGSEVNAILEKEHSGKGRK